MIKFIIGLLVINILSALFVGFLYNEYIRKVRCSDFLSQEDAQRAFINGKKYLDADHDDIACENL